LPCSKEQAKAAPSCAGRNTSTNFSTPSSATEPRTRTNQLQSYGKVASLVHLAAFYDFSGEPSLMYEKVTVEGTKRLLLASRHLDLHQLVFSSTTLVHAPTEPGQPITEEAPLEHKWAYHESKVKTEAVVRQSAASPYVILRLAGVYDDCHSIPIANQIQRIYERKLIARVFSGDPERGQPFVHLDDAVDAIARAVDRRDELARSETLLIGEEQVMTCAALQRVVSKTLHGEEWETQSIPKAIAKAGAWIQDHAPGEDPFIKPWMIELADDHLEIDVSRARRRLGWTPRHSLKSSMPRILERLQKDPVRWYRVNDLVMPAWLENAGAKKAAAE
jgi:nucleoside-diphosphate-sugar epimerase